MCIKNYVLTFSKITKTSICSSSLTWQFLAIFPMYILIDCLYQVSPDFLAIVFFSFTFPTIWRIQLVKSWSSACFSHSHLGRYHHIFCWTFLEANFGSTFFFKSGGKFLKSFSTRWEMLWIMMLNFLNARGYHEQKEKKTQALSCFVWRAF